MILGHFHAAERATPEKTDAKTGAFIGARVPSNRIGALDDPVLSWRSREVRLASLSVAEHDSVNVGWLVCKAVE